MSAESAGALARAFSALAIIRSKPGALPQAGIELERAVGARQGKSISDSDSLNGNSATRQNGRARTGNFWEDSRWHLAVKERYSTFVTS
jgi:hypothetical protein